VDGRPATFFSPDDFADAFPAVLDGFWLDVKLFLVVEVAVLVLGLVIALARLSRNPALFPLRLLSAVFVDVLRGVPTILVVCLIGFGVPALMLSGLPTDPGGDRVRPRPAGGVPGRPDRGVVELLLHAAGRRGAALPLRHRAAGAAAGPLGAVAPPMTARLLDAGRL
jgi:ABC-type amino acid transport system permease subunit